ncbi:MAG: Uma2 family endonuclease [Lamprobacter sp.]|uniref:Uma2 family endonuclease n=1 Tax=Lamprobacter sp. TaxID=3100796 RepID=UPI002B25F616|nr:Uma2 family endonuclease [Lamprobacter sp.]MEA3642194.1 Uma2 family endonuclease [Lamprobacter sp.]
MTLITELETDVVYPDSDGRPMAESDFQREPLIYAVNALRRWFHAREDVYVSGNILLYYEQGNPRAAVAPDVLVVLGAPSHNRRSYKLWEEPKAPDFVIEITSRATVSEDQGNKRGLYAYLGVSEYWQYDPTGDYLKPALAGFRLIDRNYWPIPVRSDAEGTLVGVSEVLGLMLRLDGNGFHFADAETGQLLLTYDELEEARLEAEAVRFETERALRDAELKATREAALRHEAEQRIAALEAQLRERE